jgi:TRAP transporter 4TM/12TM fusion protein
MVAYHLVYTHYLLQGLMEHKITHLGMALLILFLLSLREGGKYWPMKLVLVVVVVAVFVYIWVNYPRLAIFGMVRPTTLDIVVGIIVILLCLEATRRTFGLVLPLVAILAIVYFFVGPYLPSMLLRAVDLRWDTIVQVLSLGFAHTGVFGPLLEVSANLIFLFMVFAALIQTAGASGFLSEVGNLIGRKVKSGAAMAAVVSSGLLGSVSGQVGPNVLITGSYTIPAMKRSGYSPEQAGAIEAAASTAGPIIPPVMGVAAFLMSGMTGIPYVRIIGVAVLPALLYIFSAALYVHLQAQKMNVAPLVTSVNYRELILRSILFFGPLLTIIVLFIKGFTVMHIGFWACVIISILSLCRKQTQLSLKAFVDGLVQGATLGASIAAVCAILGIVLASISYTGLGIRLPSAIGDWAGGNLNLLLILTAIASLILGTGMPASGAYLLVAITLAPLLVGEGVPLLAAHLFVFYLANFSFLTPPVALAAAFAAKVAGGNYLKTALESTKVGIGGFILPFMVVWVAAVTWDFSEPLFAATGLISCFIVFIGFQTSAVGYFLTNINPIERLVLMGSVVCLMAHMATTSILWFVAGAGTLVVMFVWQKRKKKALAEAF